MKIYGRLFCLLVLPCSLFAVTTESRELIESGNSFYRMGLFEEAGKQYLRAAEVDRDSPEISYNLGNVFHQKFLEAKQTAVPGVNNDRCADWEQKAVTAYKQALASEAPSLRAKALFNLGNTYAEAERRIEAIAAYEEALRIIPNDEDTKHNLELLLRGKKIPAITPVVEIPPPSKMTNTVSSSGSGPKSTNGVGKAQAMMGGAGVGDEQAGGGGWGNDSQAEGQQAGTGTASSSVIGAERTNLETATEKTDTLAKAEASASGGKTAENLAGAGGPAGASAGKAGAASPDKATATDKTAAAQSDSTNPKNQDKTISASSTRDPKRSNVLDKASKDEQRYINQWTRPPDMKKGKEQDW